MSNKFNYFGFASNMLAKRIQIQSPTAERVGVGRLENYRLDFYTSSKYWHGAPATIVPSYGSYVLGALWQIDCSNMDDLDNQEGVNQGIYIPINLPILNLNTNETIVCRAYHLTNQPKEDVRFVPSCEIPENRKPSKTYLKTIVKGAIETGLNDEYVNQLRKVQHNDTMVEALEKQFELSEIDV